MSERAWDRRLVAGLLGIGLVGVATRFHDQLGLTGDNAVYLLLARNLATGRPYDNAGFPWGYPALLAPGVALFGPANLIAAVPWLKLLTIGAFLLALALCYRLFRLRHERWFAFGAVALFAVNDVTLVYTNDLMTELPYLAATAAALLWWQTRVARGEQRVASAEPADQRRRSLRVWVIAGVLLLVPYYLRTIGLTLAVAAPLVLAWRRQWRAAVGLAAGLALGLAPWVIFTKTAGLPNYLDAWFLRDPYNPALGSVADAGEFARLFLTRLQAYATPILPTMLFPTLPGNAAAQALAWLLLAAMVVGYIRRLVRRVELPEVYVAGFLLTLGSWPWLGDRFLLPILPFLFHYLMETARWAATGVAGLLRRPNPGGVAGARPFAIAGLLAVALLALPNVARDAQVSARAVQYWQTGNVALLPDMDAAWERYFDACRWLHDNTPPAALILSRKSSITTIYAGRPSVLIPLIDPAAYDTWLRDHQIDYVLEDAFGTVHTTDHLQPALQLYPARFRLIYTTPPPETRVWQVVK